MLANQQSAQSVLEDIMYKRIYEPVDDEPLVQPDGTLLKNTVTGVSERRDELSKIVMSHYKNNAEVMKIDGMALEKPEGLLFSVLLCGSYELMAHHDIDTPVIISDYLNVGHAFFDRGETRLINAVLDKIAGSVR